MLQVASKDTSAEDQLLSSLRNGGDARHAVLLGKAAVEALGGFVGVIKKGFRVRYSASDSKLHHRFHSNSNFCPPETYDSGIVIVDVYRTEMVEVVNLHHPLKHAYRLKVSDVQLFFGEVCYDRIPTTLAHKLLDASEVLTKCRFRASPKEKMARQELADRKAEVVARSRAKSQCQVIRSALGDASAALKPSWRNSDIVSGGRSSLHNHPMKLSSKRDWSCNGQRDHCLGGQGPACYACTNGCSFHLCATCFYETETGNRGTRDKAGYDKKKWSQFLPAGPSDLDGMMDTASDLSSDDSMSSPKLLARLGSSGVERTEESPPDKNDSESEDLARAILMTTTSTKKARTSDAGHDEDEEDEESMALAEALRLSLGVDEAPPSPVAPASTSHSVSSSAPALSTYSSRNSPPSSTMLPEVNAEEKTAQEEEDTKTSDGDVLVPPLAIVSAKGVDVRECAPKVANIEGATTEPRCKWWRLSRARAILAALQSVTVRLIRTLMLSPLSKDSVARNLLQQRPSFVAHILSQSGQVCDVVDLPYSSARGISSAILQAIALLDWLPNEDKLVRDFATAAAVVNAATTNTTEAIPTASAPPSTGFEDMLIDDEFAEHVADAEAVTDILDVCLYQEFGIFGCLYGRV